MDLAAAPDHIGFLLLTIARTLRMRTREAVLKQGIDLNHIGPITVLAGGQELSQRDLGRSLRTDRTTMVRTIDELEERKLVERGASKDRRMQSIRLTAAGRNLARELHRSVRLAERDVLGALSRVEIEQLRSLLVRVHDSLEPFEP
jgi:DNA-binding MarR family transcriptional regulator